MQNYYTVQNKLLYLQSALDFPGSFLPVSNTSEDFPPMVVSPKVPPYAIDMLHIEKSTLIY